MKTIKWILTIIIIALATFAIALIFNNKMIDASSWITAGVTAFLALLGSAVLILSIWEDNKKSKDKYYHIRRLFTLSISNKHMFYKYDLTIYLYFITVLIMW